MGSLDRKIRRNQEKLAYKKFGEAFQSMKRDQQYRLETTKTLRPGERELRHKPPLAEYVRRVELFKEAQKKEAEAQRQAKLDAEKKVDLEWKEE